LERRDLRRVAGRAETRPYCLPAELASRAARTEDEDLCLVVVLVLVSFDEVGAPAESSFIGLEAAFRTDERPLHTRTFAAVADGGKMSKTAYRLSVR
jgi:hypothetical protein